MPAATVTTTNKTNVCISGIQKARLLNKLKSRAELQQQLAVLEHAMKRNTDEIEEIRADIGEKSFELDGYRVTRIEGTYKRFDPKVYLAAGGDLRVYEAALVEKPKKPFTKITMPGQRDEPGVE